MELKRLLAVVILLCSSSFDCVLSCVLSVYCQLCIVVCDISQHLGGREQRTEDCRLAWATEGDPAPPKNKPPNSSRMYQLMFSILVYPTWSYRHLYIYYTILLLLLHCKMFTTNQHVMLCWQQPQMLWICYISCLPQDPTSRDRSIPLFVDTLWYPYNDKSLTIHFLNHAR